VEIIDFYNEDLRILTSLIQAVHKFSNLEEIYRVALDLVTELENVDMAMIYLVDERKREAVLKAYRNLPEDYIERARRIPYPKGVTWKVINTGKILNIEDVQKDPDVGPAGRDIGPHGVLGIPIFLEEKVIGVIWFVSYKEYKFNEREISLLSTLGNQIAIAISRTKQTEELEQRNENLSILSAISQAVHESVDLNKIYEIVLDITKDLRFINLVALYLVEGEGDKREAVLQIQRGYPEEYLKRASRIPYPKGVTWKVIISGEVVYYEDTSDPSAIIGPAGKVLGQRALLCIPLKSGNQTIGMIGFSSFEKISFTQQEFDFLLSLGSQIGTAIAKARMFEEMEGREDTLRESKEKFRNLVEQTNDFVWEIDENGAFTYVNPKAYEILGYEPEEILGRTVFDFMSSDEAKRFAEVIGSFISIKSPFKNLEKTLIHKDGHAVVLEASGSPIFNAEGILRGYRGIARDITERKKAEEALRKAHEELEARVRERTAALTAVNEALEAEISERKRVEEQIKASLQEKEVLLREIHHRVKNNLQVISSLLSLQAGHIKDKQILKAFTESQMRIRSMSLIHEQLYKSKDLARIDFSRYIRELTDNLKRSYGMTSSLVEFNIDVGRVSLGIDMAIPCGLIINELVSNSLKHAFPGGREGEISISLQGRATSLPNFVLTVSDNGIGFPKDLDFRNTESLGLQLVTVLVNQIGGTIELNRDSGTEFKITFKELKEKKG
jgi:PAS domain S-box-containing protein